NSTITTRTSKYHRWILAPDLRRDRTATVATAESLVRQAVGRQLESDVPLGSLLSGGIDSSLVACAAQAAMDRRLKTFNVRFAEPQYDETWAAAAVARHVGTAHQILDIDSRRGTWDDVTGLLLHAGQPFADTSLFAVNAVCRSMRQRVA